MFGRVHAYSIIGLEGNLVRLSTNFIPYYSINDEHVATVKVVGHCRGLVRLSANFIP